MSIFPVAVIFACGIIGTRPVVYIDLTAVFLTSVIALDPLGLVKTALSPGTRAGLTIGGVLVLFCLQVPDIDLYFRVWGIVMGVVIALTCLLCNGHWMVLYRVRQSASVDKTLAYLAHGGELPGAKAWDNYGCRESRALLHQAMGMECGERVLNSSYKAVYLLAFIHGSSGYEQKVKNLQKRVKDLEQEQILDMEFFDSLEQKNKEIETLRLALEEERGVNLGLRMKLKRMNEAPKDRNTALLAYLDAGHSYREASEAFGLSKARISGIVKEHKEHGEEVAS